MASAAASIWLPIGCRSTLVLFEERAAWARFYLEPVDSGAEGATDAVRRIVRGETSVEP